MRILFTSNYSLDNIERACAAEEWPRHHLWGLDALRAVGHEVITLPRAERQLLRRVSRAAHFQLGDLAKESLALPTIRREQIDVVICSEMGSMRALGMLRRLRILKTPLIGVLHPAPPSSAAARWSVQGFDRVLCLSDAIRHEVGSAPDGTPPRRIGWGPDLTFSGYRAEPGTHIVSNGRTHRDNALLARASARAGVPLLVDGAATGADAPMARATAPRPMGDVLADARRAVVVAIPLIRADGCFGITEVNDALALGKPVLMTRNRFIDVDIEAIGCGRWIDAGDESGWVREIAALLEDPDHAEAMGARGRAHAARHWNYERFCTDLLETVASIR